MFHGDENIWYEDENVNCAWNLNYYNHIKLLACTFQKIYITQAALSFIIIIIIIITTSKTTYYFYIILHYYNDDVG